MREPEQAVFLSGSFLDSFESLLRGFDLFKATFSCSS